LRRFARKFREISHNFYRGILRKFAKLYHGLKKSSQKCYFFHLEAFHKYYEVPALVTATKSTKLWDILTRKVGMANIISKALKPKLKNPNTFSICPFKIPGRSKIVSAEGHLGSIDRDFSRIFTPPVLHNKKDLFQLAHQRISIIHGQMRESCPALFRG
jgi:hypothetical protein